MAIQETELDVFIDDNLDALQDKHAENYMGTDDDMPEDFDNWVVNYDLSELKAMLK